ncbi:hypothetical protein P280DRAFT_313979 [Massarina eburnea CBS 473.64]|uniref:Uncharacterized protein n=1 Tax=Massarina eburnea CBS 473.64 TaxID=1395130 RepID=A0A6A6S2A7_9PLEO|nr:hypothetical protein P280DRAFT_313979 [Massarina eburnea CBS 473.64]
MCFCTQYDSHCGHSWVSLSEPCGFLQDFLNCPHRNIIRMCIAPSGVCPQCFGGPADSETIEMIQGPWGCNQMIRSQIGGPQVIPGNWGRAQLHPQHWGNQPMLPGFGVDHRLLGPLAPVPSGLGMVSPSMGIASPHMGAVSPNMGMVVHQGSPVQNMVCYDNGYGDYYDGCYDSGYGGRRGRYNRDERHIRRYRHKVREGGPGCTVM